MDEVQERPYCSDLSLQAHEPLAATATPTTQFLFLENNGAWGEKAFEESDVPEALKQHLNAYTHSRADCKILLMRSPRSLAEPGVRFLAAQLGEGPSTIYDFHVESYADLLQVSLDDLFAGRENNAGQPRTGPVYLVCTHGRRDRCCVRAGIPVYTALQETARLEDRNMGVWQSSHVGGHRFAANLICLSSGLLYGRVHPGDVSSIMQAERRGEMRLENLRGRLSYSQPAQAAELALRRQTGALGLQAYHLEAAVEESSGEWSVTFLSAQDERFRVRVAAHKTGTRVFESCTLDKTTALVEYETWVTRL